MCHQHCETDTSSPRPRVSSVTVSLWNTYLLTSASGLFCHSIIVIHIPLDLGLMSLPSKYHCETQYLLTLASCLFCHSIIVKQIPLDLGLMSLLSQYHCDTHTSWPRPHVSSVKVSLWNTHLLTSASCLFCCSILISNSSILWTSVVAPGSVDDVFKSPFSRSNWKAVDVDFILRLPGRFRILLACHKQIPGRLWILLACHKHILGLFCQILNPKIAK